MSQGGWQTDQMGGACKQQPTPGRNVACVKNCGFFGNETTLNMCTNCYRNYLVSRSDGGNIAASGSSDQETAIMEDSAAAGNTAAPPMQGVVSAQDDDSDMNLIARASTVESSAAVESRARFPRVQSASERDTRGPSSQGSAAGSRVLPAEDACAAMPCGNSSVDISADALVRTNASRTLDVDLDAKASVLPPATSVLTSHAPKPLCIPPTPARVSSSAGPKPSRCQVCRKKVGLTGFKCRCEGLFCGSHRYSDKHDCSFDYKAAGREAIARANPIVVADKIIRF